MPKLFSNLEGIPTASTNTPISQPPSQLHTLHRCIKIHLCRRIDTTQQWHGPPHHLCQWTIPWITDKLGNTHKGSLHNLHVSKETQFLHRHSQNNSQEQSPPTKEILRKEHLKLQSEQLGS